MRVADAEGHPIELFRGTLAYWPWLAREILASGWQVTKIILSPRLSISPTLIDVEASQKTNAARAAYANSITLTPGTITVGVSDRTFTVHSLTREGADTLERGAMDARVRRLEGSS
jgi:multicomponent Na+:H+ antiporter subunit E